MRSQRRGTNLPVLFCLLTFCGFAWAGAQAYAKPAAVSDRATQARQDRDDEDTKLLSEADIELIKVYEVDLDTDPPPRISIPRDELRDFLKEYQSEDSVPRGKKAQEDWLREDGTVQLALLFKLRARDYYKHVRVRSQVESLREWRSIHKNYILGYFQPTFGDGDVPGLLLYPRGRRSNEIEMTNFYILTQTSLKGLRMIDRNNPAESLILQWGLPREAAKFPAPDDLKGWRPHFKSTDDPRFKEMVAWVKTLIRANQGSTYDIDYRLPGQPDEPEEDKDAEEKE